MCKWSFSGVSESCGNFQTLIRIPAVEQELILEQKAEKALI
jgi:hypothetical protein